MHQQQQHQLPATHENIYHQANTISHIHEKYQQQQQQHGYGGQVLNDYTPPMPPMRNGEVSAVHHTMQHSPIPPELPMRNGMATLGPQRNKANGRCNPGVEIDLGNGRRTMSGRHFH